MKRTLTLLLILCSIFILSALNESENPRTKAFSFYLDGLNELSGSTEELSMISADYVSGKKKFKHFKEQVRICRLNFKRIEVLAEYFDPQMISDKINGAPLPKIERKAPNLVIFEPKGLQRLDEIAADESEADPEEIKKLSKELYESCQQLEEVQSRIKVYDRHIFEACRTELIRTFSLGLTGFDAPGTLNSIEEAKTVFNSISFLLQLYMEDISEYNQNIAVEMTNQIQSISRKLEYADFEELDRLSLLRNSILPLYENILKAQKGLMIELPHEYKAKLGAVNYQAEGFFDEDFLRAEYYSRISNRDKNEKLKELGQFLFFDPILSEGNEMACASCHKPEKAFQDGLAKSQASHKMGTVERNAPGLINSVYAARYFHDLRAGELQSQVEHVIFAEDEFNTTYKRIIEDISKSEEYVQLFSEAFPQVKEDRVNPYTVSMAVTEYVESLRSWNSNFDRYVRRESDELSASAKRGFNLFMGKANCGTCHFAPSFAGLVPPLFTESESEVLGVTTSFDTINPVLDDDMGRYANGRIKERAAHYKRSFKTVTVRNIEFTAPYMHNGGFETLEEVMHFYNKGGGEGLGLEVPHQTLGADPLDLSQNEMNDIISFMKSLSDTSNLVHRPGRLPKFNDPNLDDRLGKVGI